MEGKAIFYNSGTDGRYFVMLNVAVSIPVVKNIKTAVIDRKDNLGKPHSPCPLVHPEPSCVPMPTNAPDTIN